MAMAKYDQEFHKTQLSCISVYYRSFLTFVALEYTQKSGNR